jgi:membrane-bound lytic murein transglycosylase MltF
MIRKKTILWLSLVALCTLAAVVVGRRPGREKTVRDWPEIRTSGILNIVTEYNADGYHLSGDTVSGFQYTLCRRVEARSGLTVRILLANDWDDCLQMLHDHRCDAIALNIPITGESRTTLAFTHPIAQNRQVLVQRRPGNADSLPLIRNQMDLGGKTIWTPAHSPTLLRLKNLSEEIAAPIHIRQVENYTQEQLLYLVAYGEADYAIVDRALAEKNAPLFPQLDTTTDIGFTQLQAWAVRKDAPALLDSLNRWLTE